LTVSQLFTGNAEIIRRAITPEKRRPATAKTAPNYAAATADVG
jgi:hypothetical protein